MNNLTLNNTEDNSTLFNEKTIAIKILTDHFSINNIPLESFEKAVSAIENSRSFDEIRNTCLGLGINERTLILHTYSRIPKSQTIHSIGSKKHIHGDQLVVSTLNIEMAHTTIILDYSSVDLPNGNYELVFNCKHAKCIIILPDNIDIKTNINEYFSKIIDKRKTQISMNVSFLFSGKLHFSKIIIKKAKIKKKTN